jgi:inner membrane protein
LQKLKRFSQEFCTAEKWGDTLVFNDLRFGQIMGWQNPKGKFVFHYFLKDSADNKLVVQRGRFEGWDKDAFNSLLKRIKGN